MAQVNPKQTPGAHLLKFQIEWDRGAMGSILKVHAAVNEFKFVFFFKAEFEKEYRKPIGEKVHEMARSDDYITS